MCLTESVFFNIDLMDPNWNSRIVQDSNQGPSNHQTRATPIDQSNPSNYKNQIVQKTHQNSPVFTFNRHWTTWISLLGPWNIFGEQYPVQGSGDRIVPILEWSAWQYGSRTPYGPNIIGSIGTSISSKNSELDSNLNMSHHLEKFSFTKTKLVQNKKFVQTWNHRIRPTQN